MLKSLNHKVRIARQLSLPDWLALMEAWWMLLAAYLALRWLSYEHLTGMAHPQPDAGLPDQLTSAQRLAHLVHLASRLHHLRITCLPRSLTLRWMLGRRGIRSRLCLGATKTLDKFHAHAWVEIQGQAIGESDELAEKFHLLVPGENTLS